MMLLTFMMAALVFGCGKDKTSEEAASSTVEIEENSEITSESVIIESIEYTK